MSDNRREVVRIVRTRDMDRIEFEDGHLNRGEAGIADGVHVGDMILCAQCVLEDASQSKPAWATAVVPWGKPLNLTPAFLFEDAEGNRLAMVRSRTGSTDA